MKRAWFCLVLFVAFVPAAFCEGTGALENRNVRLEFEIWGRIPFNGNETDDVAVQQILLSIRTEPKSCEEIAEQTSVQPVAVKRKIAELARLDLVRLEGTETERWVANIPIYLKSELAMAEEIGLKYAKIEAFLLRSFLPETREVYESCSVSKYFPWDDISFIVMGAIISDLAVYDRVRFFPEYFRESLLPPEHPDGSRWEYTGYEISDRRYQASQRAFHHNLHRGGRVNWACWGYHNPSEQRQDDPVSFDNPPYSAVFNALWKRPMAVEKLEKASGLSSGELARVLEELTATDPPLVGQKDGAFFLNFPVFTAADIRRLIPHADKVAEVIHNRVTIPCEQERIEAGKRLGLRYPLGEGNLARDLALQWLVDEGLLSEIPPPPVPWNFGRWGWKGKFPMWEEVTAARSGSQEPGSS